MAKLSKRNGVYVVNELSIGAVNQMYLEEDRDNFLEVNVSFVDKRLITEQQRKFIFALCGEISYYLGNEKEYIRLLLQQYNANLRGIEVESLSSCSVTYANGLIDTIIDFCIEKEIPISGEVITEHQYQFNKHQVYMMCLKRICVICGARADIHHVDHIGRGYNRNKISHIGKRALPLCRIHHGECHNIGEEKFIEKYHLVPIVIDKKMEYFIKKGTLKYFKEKGVIRNANKCN